MIVMDTNQSRTSLPKWPSYRMEDFLDFWRYELEGYGSGQILHWAIEHFHPKLAMVSSLGPNGCVLMDMLAKLDPKITVVNIDTGYQHVETLRLHENLRLRYKIDIVYHSHELGTKEYESLNGGPVYRNHPHRCCQERKYRIFQRVAPQFDALICDIRRDQNPTSTKLRVLEWDERLGVIRISPLARWTKRSVWDKIHRDSIPYNRLFEKGYARIRCAPCLAMNYFEE